MIAVAGVYFGRSLAHRPPAASGLATLFGSKIVLPPAMLVSPAGFLQTDARVHHTVTRLPQSGCSRRTHSHYKHTNTLQNAATIPKVCSLQNNPSGTLNVPMQRLI